MNFNMKFWGLSPILCWKDHWNPKNALTRRKTVFQATLNWPDEKLLLLLTSSHPFLSCARIAPDNARSQTPITASCARIATQTLWPRRAQRSIAWAFENAEVLGVAHNNVEKLLQRQSNDPSRFSSSQSMDRRSMHGKTVSKSNSIIVVIFSNVFNVFIATGIISSSIGQFGDDRNRFEPINQVAFEDASDK